MKVAVVVPTYNGEKFLAQTLESVLAQTIQDFEIIVVDDGSRDGTVGIAKQFTERDARIRVFKQENQGVGAARNRGFCEASDEVVYFAFLDQDDVLEPDALEVLRRKLESEPTAYAAHGDARYIDANGQTIRHGELEAKSSVRHAIVDGKAVDWPVTKPTTFAVLAYWGCIHTPGQAMIRRAALEHIGLFDTQTSLPDVDIWVRLAQYSDVAYVNRVVLNYRWHETNTSRQSTQMDEGILYVRRKMLAETTLTSEQRRLAMQGSKLWQRDIARIRCQWAREELRGMRLIRAANQLRHAVLSYYRGTLGAPV